MKDTTKQIEKIRQACIKANPDRKYIGSLADVLLLLSSLSLSDLRYLTLRNKLLDNWWLTQDLENQRPERLQFLADLL